MPNNTTDEKINAPRLTITTKGNGCPACGAPKLACRCPGSGSGGGSEEPSQDLESKESVKLSTLSIFRQELKPQKIDVATQNESANKGNDKNNISSSIPNPYALPKYTAL